MRGSGPKRILLGKAVALRQGTGKQGGGLGAAKRQPIPGTHNADGRKTGRIQIEGAQLTDMLCLSDRHYKVGRLPVGIIKRPICLFFNHTITRNASKKETVSR
jgi:hypothetical protein